LLNQSIPRAYDSYKNIFHEDAAVLVFSFSSHSLFLAACRPVPRFHPHSIRLILFGLVHVEVPLPGGAAIYRAISTGLLSGSIGRFSAVTQMRLQLNTFLRPIS
jgi:hypothetical protein